LDLMITSASFSVFFQMASTNHYAGIHCLAFCHEWMHCFNKLTGAPSGEVLPELVNLYKPPFYLATWKDGAALLTNKLHSKGMLPKDVIFFAPCHVGGIKGRETALASLEAEGFTREEPSSEFGHRSREATLAPLEAEGFMREEASLEFDRQGREGAVNNLINEGVDPKKASSELMIPVAANRRKNWYLQISWWVQ
jgi:hypothetical protein